jgi:3-oxoacyl-[acyl-carrier-protein] synthase II
VTSRRRVLVTGIGAITAAGAGQAALLEALRHRRSGVRPDAAAGVPAGRAPDPPHRGAARRLDRSAALFITAAEEAWQDAGLAEGAVDPARCGVVEGSSLGPMAGLLEGACDDTPPRPTDLLRYMAGAGGASTARGHHIHGSVLHVSAGSVSALCAIGEACLHIASGRADVMVAGGAECPLQPEIVSRFRVAGVLAASHEGGPACRPFDPRRSGTVLGEGAGVLILEAEDHAARRGARLRAEVEGYGLVCESFSMIRPDPDGVGVIEAASAALEGLAVDQIDWIKSHGTGTRANDAAECHGLARLLGDKLRSTPMTSLKPALGHCLGASGAVEAVATVLAMEQGFIPATLGTEQVDPELPPCRIVTQIEAVHARHVLMLAESFGGRCAALLLGRA